MEKKYQVLLFNLNIVSMKIITKNSLYEKEFLRLMNAYDKYYWLAAWAGISSSAYEQLRQSKSKIKKIIVGLHFYQTHPCFIKEFMDVADVKYIKQTKGTYHPKMYLFYNSDHYWEAIIGSANFTCAAFNDNFETSVLVTSEDVDSKVGIATIFDAVNAAWNDADLFTVKELHDYENFWKNNRPKFNSLSGQYGGFARKSSNKPIYLVPVASISWNEFISGVLNENKKREGAIRSRLKLLDTAKFLFAKDKSFDKLTLDERKFIAGIPNKYLPEDDMEIWAFFGSMQGAGKYKHKIIENDKNISEALDEIPSSGQVTKFHYSRFINKYSLSFEGNYLATATRLLAMKRPDIFVCLDDRNRSSLCKDFELVKSGLDYNRYWDDIVERIYDSVWWQNPMPQNEEERRISNYRAAFLDSLYYEKH